MVNFVQLQGISLVVSGLFSLLVFIRSHDSAQKHQSIALRYISYGALALSLDFLFEGLPLMLTPNNQLAIALGITVFGPILIHLTLSFLFSIVIVTLRPSIPINYRLIILVVGIFAGALNLAHNQGTVSFSAGGFVNPGFNPIAEFITFFTTILVVFAFAATFFQGNKQGKLSIRAVLIGAGAIAVGISSPIVYSANDPLIFAVLNSLTNVGMLAITIGTYMSLGRSKQQITGNS